MSTAVERSSRAACARVEGTGRGAALLSRLFSAGDYLKRASRSHCLRLWAQSPVLCTLSSSLGSSGCIQAPGERARTTEPHARRY